MNMRMAAEKTARPPSVMKGKETKFSSKGICKKGRENRKGRTESKRLSDSESSDGRSREDHGCQGRESDDDDSGEDGTSNVKELVLTSSSTDISQRTHDTDGVKPSSSEEGWREEEEWGDRDRLSDLEGREEEELLDGVLRGGL